MPSLREQVRARARDLCEYCQLSQQHTVLPHELDHIRAQKHAGPTNLENLCWACAYCNSAKGPNIAGYDPSTGELTPLFNPRTQDWNAHFQWNEGSLVGKTASGRVTIQVLNINAPERVEHRRLVLQSSKRS